MRQAMKTQRRIKSVPTIYLTSVLDGGEWSTPPAAALPPGKKAGTHCAGG